MVGWPSTRKTTIAGGSSAKHSHIVRRDPSLKRTYPASPKYESWKRAKSLGGGRVRTNLNFLSVTEGDRRTYDFLTAMCERGQEQRGGGTIAQEGSNLGPKFINVFVTGGSTPGGIAVE